MSKKKDGGPAFPASFTARSDGRLEFPIAGMTVRQYYAGQALAGVTLQLTLSRHPQLTFQKIAQDCVFQADALIDELNKELPE